MSQKTSKISNYLAYIALLCLPMSAIGAISVSDIVGILSKQKPPDTLDMRVQTLVSAKGFQAVTKMHLITKGTEKIWMELDTPLGLQRIIRNGKLYKIEDVRTGKVEYPTMAPEALNSLPTQVSQGTEILGKGRFYAPIEIKKGVYRLNLIEKSDTLVKSRVIVADLNRRCLIQYTEVTLRGDTTETVMDYGKEKRPRFPKKITMTVRSGAEPTTIEISIPSAVEPKNTSDALFQIIK